MEINALDYTKSVLEKGKNFTHLHFHTSYSFLDGFNDPFEAAKRVKELGMSSVAITDHNHLGGCLDFQKACNNEGLQPILGAELYWTWDTNILSMPVEERTQWAIDRARADGIDVPEIKGKIKKKDIQALIDPYEYDKKQYHVLFLATSQKGWKNLVKLQSEAANKCTYNGRFLLDNEILKKYNEDVIMTTACISNTAAHMFIKGRDEEAFEVLSQWKEIFQDRFYVEIQPLNIEKQWTANAKLVRWAKDNDVKLVATNDVHYTRKEDHDDHDTLLCVGIGKQKADKARMTYSNDFWIKSYEEMIEGFSNQAQMMMDVEHFEGKELFDAKEYLDAAIEALENTNEVARRCESIKLGSDKPVFPRLEVPHNMTPESFLTMKCYQNLYKYKLKHKEIDLKVYEARLKEELDIINPKGFAPYMLIVEEYIEWANANDCPTGPGRGSAAGSLVLFLLGVTKMIDPIKYQLLFFRFLTADRTSPPDWKRSYRLCDTLHSRAS